MLLTNKKSYRSNFFCLSESVLEITFINHFFLYLSYMHRREIYFFIMRIEVFIITSIEFIVDNSVLSSCRYESSDNNVFFELFEFIYLSRNRALYEYSHSFLERSSRKPAIRIKRYLGNTKKEPLSYTCSFSFREKFIINIFKLDNIYDITREKFRVSFIENSNS